MKKYYITLLLLCNMLSVFATNEKPSKPTLEVDTIHTENYGYDLHATFNSQGATSYYVTIEYPDYGDAYGKYVNQSGEVSITESNLYVGDNVKFSVAGVNGHGNSESATVSFDALDLSGIESNELPTTKEFITFNNDEILIDGLDNTNRYLITLHSPMGLLLKKIEAYELSFVKWDTKSLNHGIYIITVTNFNTSISTSKKITKQ